MHPYVSIRQWQIPSFHPRSICTLAPVCVRGDEVQGHAAVELNGSGHSTARIIATPIDEHAHLADIQSTESQYSQ